MRKTDEIFQEKNEKNLVCCVCSSRMRVLNKQLECPICKQEMEWVVLHDSFFDFDQINLTSLKKEPHYGMAFVNSG